MRQRRQTGYAKKIGGLILCAWLLVGCGPPETPIPPPPPPAAPQAAGPEATSPPVSPAPAPPVAGNTATPPSPAPAPATLPDLTQLWSNGLTSKRTGEPLVTADGMHNLDPALVAYGYNLVVDSAGTPLPPQGTPLRGGEQLVQTTAYQDDANVREYARVVALMAPIRDTILYNFEHTSRAQWLAVTEVLARNNIKTVDAASVDARSVLSSGQVYDYIASSPTDGSPVMRYLEEAELELKCLAFVDFNFTNPEGNNHCEAQNIPVGSGIQMP